jgi:hypothetical protein
MLQDEYFHLQKMISLVSRKRLVSPAFSEADGYA